MDIWSTILTQQRMLHSMASSSPLESLSEPSSAPAPKPTKRILACIQCQQRKVKCDRTFPCSTCVKAKLNCIPANSLPPKPRRRRFPERELLDRLQHYEEILRKHRIQFNPLHGVSPPGQSVSSDSPGKDGDDTPASKNALDLWMAISRVTLEPGDDDDDDDAPTTLTDDDDAIAKAYTERFNALHWPSLNSNDHLLFGAPTSVVLSNLHPPQVHMFRLWQIYLDNVNPLLKLTHTPTLQPRIIDAMSNPTNVDPALEALIFSIYCIAVVTLSNAECMSLFQCPRNSMLTIFHNACQQALIKCGIWQVGSDEGLSALLLYLMSLKAIADMRSITSMLATAIRTAQRLGIHMESTYLKCTPLQSEMRRRIWWALVTFDHRMCEMCDYRTSSLLPTWDCQVPLNVNDFDLRADMKAAPGVGDKPSEACFVVTRARMNEVLRHNALHLNFVNPTLKALARPSDLNSIDKIDKEMTEKFESWDMADPLQFMTSVTTAAMIARCRLLDHYSAHSASLTRPTMDQRTTALTYALKMLECDTILRTSMLTRPFLWFTDLYFPALAYHHILNGLTHKIRHEDAVNVWRIMEEHYAAVLSRPALSEEESRPFVMRFFTTSGAVILLAWRTFLARERELGRTAVEPPQLVSDIMNHLHVPQSTQSLSLDLTLEQDGGQNRPDFPAGWEIENNMAPRNYLADDTLGQAIMEVDSDDFWNGLGLGQQ